MNKILVILAAIFMFFSFAAFKVLANDVKKVNDIKKEQVMQNKKVLVAYFSWGGNTKSVAEKIQTITGGDIFELVAKTPYPADYHETTVVAKEQIQNNKIVELKENIDISGYDIIFVGTPAWWYTMAPVVKTFLTEGNFEGKTVVPFVTHGGGGGYSIAKEMGEYAKGSKVAKPFVVYGKGDADTIKDLEGWIKEIN